ncbi:MaoC/PaaZ C-terminal domain-containing protein [Chloroflexota bacterium]
MGEYYVDKEEMIEFAEKWDALPFHIDEELAKSYPSGGLIAPAVYTLSVIRRLNTVTKQPALAILVGLGYEKVQIVNPVRPGDKLVVTKEYIGKRESRTEADRGIIRTLNEVKNQNDELCLSTITVALVAKRPA